MKRLIAASVAFACAVAGAALAWHYPVAQPLAFTLFLAWALCCLRWPSIWLVAIPALLPVTGFATWTGWFAFEELDLLVLGAATGAYARLAWRLKSPDSEEILSRPGISPLIIALAALLAVSYLTALIRGMSAAGGLVFDWIGSYDSAMNSLRIAKSFFEPLLLWPLLRSALIADDRRTIDALASGFAMGLGLVSIAVLWERAAFTDLLNFSSDYRTTALFWEMHVGGAALDGYLALTAPFVIWELRRTRSLLHLWLSIALAAVAAYACLTTFSRGVYIAVPAGLAFLALLLARSRRTPMESASGVAPRQIVVLSIIGAVGAYFAFRHGGYRSLIALVATAAVGLWVAPIAKAASHREWTVAAIAGAGAGVLASVAAMTFGKGPYVIFALALASNAGLCLRPINGSDRRWVAVRLAAFAFLIVAAASVAFHWGGVDALAENTLALCLVVGLTLGSRFSPAPSVPTDLRSRAIYVGVLCLLGGGVAVLAGGAYMGGRFSNASEDLELRVKHWRDSLGMLRAGTDWWIGKGLGRFPAEYFFSVTEREHPGSFSLQNDARPYLRLAGPRYPTSWGDLFRIAQRVGPLPTPYTATLTVRSPSETELHLEICEQHLLYNASCAVASPILQSSPDWQQISVVLNGRQVSRGPWYAPRLAFFAMAVASNGVAIDIRDVAIVGPDGRDLIANGDFALGMERWIPISERYHLPWHAKNLALNILFDQGVIGLTIFMVLLITAIWRLAFGRTHKHPIEPFLAASLVGFVLVGAFDSLLDAPRVAFLFYLLLLTALSLPTPASTDAYEN